MVTCKLLIDANGGHLSLEITNLVDQRKLDTVLTRSKQNFSLAPTRPEKTLSHVREQH